MEQAQSFVGLKPTVHLAPRRDVADQNFVCQLIDSIDNTLTAHPVRPRAFSIRERFGKRPKGVFGQLF